MLLRADQERSDTGRERWGLGFRRSIIVWVARLRMACAEALVAGLDAEA